MATSTGKKEPVLLTSDLNGVRTLTFNLPHKLNGWTEELRTAMLNGIRDAGNDPNVKAIIITGNGKYYSAGADFGGSMKPMSPSSLKEFVRASNKELFETYLVCPKPMFAAVNGPAIGAAVTSASLCDAVVASESATFLTPFKSLGLVPEGCSSYNFPKIFGEEMAKEVLEGRKFDAEEALKYGFAQYVVPQENVLEKAQEVAEAWVQQNHPRRSIKLGIKDKLMAVNDEESIALANAILDYPFIQHQAKFAMEKGKYAPWFLFKVLGATRPLWSRL